MPPPEQSASTRPTETDQHKILQNNQLGRKAQPLPRYRRPARLIAAALALIGLTLLTIAALLHPDAAGLGTHQQLNLPPCGFYQRTGYPCPTCGMTTAFALTVRGRIIQAFATQPAGAIAAVVLVAVTAVAAYVAVTARNLDRLLFRINYPALLITAAALVLAAWLYLCAVTRLGLR